MSEQRLKWDRSEVLRLRELYLKSPDMPVPLLTEAFNMTTPRHRTKNAVKCQLRLVRAELEEGGPVIATSATSATSATPATFLPRNLLNEENSVWSAPELNIFIPRHPLEGEIPRLVVYTPCPELSQEMVD
ncbi:hypothetical protein V500_01503 [Pseudogymnoascus sp. VKM F-4518 (FW-2643)]|nr:hypothetical protein V500_01503 [Pseudogymnoascus sp. VKM F-4518 (FW-2643)]